MSLGKKDAKYIFNKSTKRIAGVNLQPFKGFRMLQTKSSPNNLSHLNRDRGYRFRDRDPVLDEICPLIEKSGLETKQISKKIAEMSHSTAVVSFSTIDKWLNGKTIRPQNFTVTWVMAAIGYERKWKKIR